MGFLRKILPVPIKALLRPIYYGFFAFLSFLVRVLIRILSAVLGKKRFLMLSQFVAREIDTTLEVAGITFDATDEVPLARALSILSKEPDTIAWIQETLKENDIFYDIGANVGVFSLYAAKHKAATVVAFEPFAPNYALLNHNIFLNGLSESITALNIAINDKSALSHLNVSSLRPGKAGNSFGNAIGSRGNAYEPIFRQGVIGMSLDDFIASYDTPFPTHIKIDVDGNEPLIIEGMGKTMADARLKSIAVEINNDLPRHVDALEKIKAHGFTPLSEERFVNRDYLAMANVQNYFLVRG